MVRTLVVGLGRAGAELHLPVLARARTGARQLFGDEPVVACDPRRVLGDRPGLVTATSLAQAASVLDAEETVAHVCTPPAVRTQVIGELAERGFRNLIVDKPLAADTDDLARIIRLRRKRGLRIAVVEPWLTSSLTARLTELVRGGTLGDPRSIAIVQNKPRFRRSLSRPGHQTAFDVELPHGVGLALRLAGNARVTHAAGSDLVVGDVVVPRMGGARVGLRHNSGVRTEISSDLTSPVRERRITIKFDQATVVGHYAVSADDDHSQLTVTRNGHGEHEVLRDDSLTEWVIRAYQLFRGVGDQHARGFAFATDVVQLLSVAKNICAEPVVPAARAETAVAVHAR
ncbi:putative dehydrogenase [Saccharothrix tamanrassetensis]|uniref:Putative dehydrogenase n=1 Tax=Saccharothrix tamanrassetensis TaxID=1051531 RepID=A0A841CLB5_9PSEU|nr:Gfo/Idh/MocA family oxidoreductase [Saccharothrix tamanrassetensis]MBB5958089.1 putative dehydrogenase [Saccharothrix tamanrassetensis]